MKMFEMSGLSGQEKQPSVEQKEIIPANGAIVRWNNDRGFGFVESNGKQYFLHASNIQPAYQSSLARLSNSSRDYFISRAKDHGETLRYPNLQGQKLLVTKIGPGRDGREEAQEVWIYDDYLRANGNQTSIPDFGIETTKTFENGEIWKGVEIPFGYGTNDSVFIPIVMFEDNKVEFETFRIKTWAIFSTAIEKIGPLITFDTNIEVEKKLIDKVKSRINELPDLMFSGKKREEVNQNIIENNFSDLFSELIILVQKEHTPESQWILVSHDLIHKYHGQTNIKIICTGRDTCIFPYSISLYAVKKISFNSENKDRNEPVQDSPIPKFTKVLEDLFAFTLSKTKVYAEPVGDPNYSPFGFND